MRYSKSNSQANLLVNYKISKFLTHRKFLKWLLQVYEAISVETKQAFFISLDCTQQRRLYLNNNSHFHISFQKRMRLISRQKCFCFGTANVAKFTLAVFGFTKKYSAYNSFIPLLAGLTQK
jgi:hypothetical protein